MKQSYVENAWGGGGELTYCGRTPFIFKFKLQKHPLNFS